MAEIILSIIYTIIFLWIIGKMPLFRCKSLSVKTFQILFLVKIAAAMFLYLIYTRFYPDRLHADIFKYYDDSLIIYNAAFQHPMDFIRMLTGITANSRDLWHYYDAMSNWFNSEMIFNDSRTMIRLNVIMRFVTFGTYFPVAIIMCFLAMLGLTGFYKIFSSILPGREFILMLLVYLLPSTLLWSSGMIKEAYLIFSIGLLLYCIHIYLGDRMINMKRTIAILFFGFSLLCIKSYVLFAILPGIVTWVICAKWNSNRPITALIIHASYLLILFNVSYLFTNHSVPELLSSKQEEFNSLATSEQAKSVIHLNVLDGTKTSLLKNIIPAFFVTLTRPIIGESKNPLILIAEIENAVIFIFMIACVIGIKRRQIKNLPAIFYLAIYFSSIMFVLIGLVTPILGAIVRYKVPSVTFLIFAIFCLAERKWVYYFPAKLKDFLSN